MKNSVLLISFLFILVFQSHLEAQNAVQFEGLKKINNTELYIKIIGKGDPLLIIHGGPGMNQAYFHPYLDALAKHYTLIFYDQRSSGKSKMCSREDMSMKLLVDDVEGIRQAFGYDKINIMAHAFGGLIATNYALEYPTHVKSLIYCNSVAMNHEFDATMIKNQDNKTSKQDSIYKDKLLTSKAYMQGDAATAEKIMLINFKASFCDTSLIKNLHPDIPANYTQASSAFYGLAKDIMVYDYFSSVSAFNFPVLIIHGACDILPAEADTKLQKSIPDSKLITFQHSGHFPFIEENKLFCKKVLKFLK